MKIRDLLEYASSGSTSSGSVASTATGLGGPMANVIKRMPAGTSFFGHAMGPPLNSTKNTNKKKQKPRKNSVDDK